MGAVFIRSLDGNTVISLDAISSVTYARTAEVTTSTMFNGSKLSDNVHANLPTVSFQGVVTSFKMRDTYPSPTEFRRLMDELLDSYELMTFYGTDDGAIPDLNNCYIIAFNVTRDVDRSNALLADVTIQQLDISTSISATTITKPAEATDGQMADNPSKSKDGTTTENSEKTRRTVAQIALDYLAQSGG